VPVARVAHDLIEPPISPPICYTCPMRILFLGGTGIISSAAGRRLAERSDVELTFFLRGRSSRAVPAGVEVLTGDLREPAVVQAALGARRFDVVVNFIAFTPAHVEADIALFRGKIGQYVFISSASAYQTPPARLPVTESTPLKNPFWQYSRDKIACEELLLAPTVSWTFRRRSCALRTPTTASRCRCMAATR
jgi:nucleoside-diphosphate-sugar epimerase